MTQEEKIILIFGFVIIIFIILGVIKFISKNNIENAFLTEKSIKTGIFDGFDQYMSVFVDLNHP